MLKHTVLSVGLALAFACAGAHAQDNGDNAGQANPAQTGDQPASSPSSSMIALGQTHSPLQEFVSRQVAEVAELSMQVDQAKAEGRPDAARSLTHFIRDHVLVADAARNLLGQRNQVATPVTMISTAPPPSTLAEMIRQDIEMHRQALNDVQQLQANASTPEERNIYQRAAQATQNHLNVLQRMDQGERVDLGFFGPTMPLSRIAGSRQQVGSARTARRHHRRAHRRR